MKSYRDAQKRAETVILQQGASRAGDTLETADKHRAFPAVVRPISRHNGKVSIKSFSHPLRHHSHRNTPAFKMQIKRTIIHIDGSNHGNLIIGQIVFGMDKSRRIFINADTGLYSGGIMGLCEQENKLFVRYAGGDYA